MYTEYASQSEVRGLEHCQVTAGCDSVRCHGANVYSTTVEEVFLSLFSSTNCSRDLSRGEGSSDEGTSIEAVNK